MERSCVKCGKSKDIKGGKVCEKGHFVCKTCVNESVGVFFGEAMKRCPICEKKLT